MSEFKTNLMNFIRSINENVKEIPDAEIPCLIHRIWVGKEMPTETIENLVRFQKGLTENNSMYVHILWTYGAMEGELLKQIERLHNCGVRIHDMKELCLGNAVEKKIDVFMENGKSVPSNYKFVSDLFRMYVLFAMGGTYMDADIDIGEEKFQETLYHRYKFETGGYMPLLGSICPFENIYEKSGGKKNAYICYERAMYDERGYAWNYLFATVKNNPVIEGMLKGLLSDRPDAQSITNNLIEQFYKSIGRVVPYNPQAALFDYAFAPLDLKYVTNASTEK